MGVTRRGAITGLAGLAGLASGCHRERPQRPEDIDAEIALSSERVGHALRDGARVEPPADAWTDVPLLIVGAGVAGLACAWRLRRAGFSDFRVVELEAAPGGTARSGESAVSKHPWGAHYVNAPGAQHASMIALLNEVGALDGVDAQGAPQVHEAAAVRDPESRIFRAGRWYEGLYLNAGESPEDVRQRLAFEAELSRLAALRDGRGRRAFTVPVSQCSDDPDLVALDREPFSAWLDRKGFTGERLRWLCDYACRDDFGATPDRVSAWAGLFYFLARRTGQGEDTRPVITWPEGNGRLVSHLAAGLGERLQTGVAVADIAPSMEPGGVARVRALDLRGDSARAVGFRARQVVLAAPVAFARFMLRPWRETRPAFATAFESAPWCVAQLELRHRPGGRGFPRAWDNVAWGSRSLGYIVATHQRGPDFGPDVWTWYEALADDPPRRARERLLSWTAADLRDRVLADLRPVHPDIDQAVTRMRFARHGHAMVHPAPGLMWGGARAAAAQAVGNVRLAHTDLSGMALFEEAFDHGLRAAEQALAAMGLPAPGGFG